MRGERVSINADEPRRSLEDRWLPGHVTGDAGGHVWGMGGFGHGRVAGGEQVDGRQQGIAFDGTVQQGGLDRKSVVSGKSVSVRVDLGGRRFIKTKINK